MHKTYTSQKLYQAVNNHNECTMYNNTTFKFPALMQPSYALLPATGYPKTVGGMCYAMIKLTSIGLKASINNQPIRGWDAK